MPSLPAPVCRFWSWLLPPRRNRLVAWTGPEVFVIVGLVILTEWLWFSFAYHYLSQTNFIRWVYGPEFSQHLALAPGTAERTAEEYRVRLWIGVLWLPFDVAVVLGACAALSGARPYQFGLTTHRIGRNILCGILGAALVSPLHVLNVYVGSWYEHLTHAPPTQHPLTLIAQYAQPVDRVLIVILAVVAAPIMEELLFRGFLQPWFTRQRIGGILAIFVALGLAVLRQWEHLDEARASANWRGFALALQPAAFVLLLAPGLLLTRRMSRPDVAGGIYGIALMFAAAHSSIWPSPIPLFPLGLVLGWLAYRTNSLVGPLTLHALFNLISCFEMFVLQVPTT